MSDTFGYPSDKPCAICGAHKNNQSEARFGYTVCEDHQDVAPAYLDQAKAAFEGGIPLVLFELERNAGRNFSRVVIVSEGKK